MTELTDDQIDAVWDSVPWQDLNVNSLEHVKVLRHRFARALLAAHSEHPAEVPEGCTPADARKLREANHRLADENHQQARTIAFLRDQNRRIIEAADRIRDGAACAADDAARYRWLRRQAVEVKNYASGNPNWEIDWALRGESFEAAVDTARKAEIERNGGSDEPA